jgi:hypothetical protein
VWNVCGNGVLREIVDHQEFKKCGQRENYVLNNLNIRTHINIIAVVWLSMMSHGVHETRILERKYMKGLAILRGQTVVGDTSV